MSQFDEWSLKERGRILTGYFAHWCDDWDGMTMDETCREFPCACYRDEVHWVEQIDKSDPFQATDERERP